MDTLYGAVVTPVYIKQNIILKTEIIIKFKKKLRNFKANSRFYLKGHSCLNSDSPSRRMHKYTYFNFIFFIIIFLMYF